MTNMKEIIRYLRDNPIWVFAIVSCIAMAIPIAMWVLSPTCEERGGKLKYFTTVLTYSAATKTMQQTPIFRCVMPEKGEK